MIVTIVGAGNMARGIGTRAMAGGHHLRLVGRSPDQARTLAGDLAATATTGEVRAMDTIDQALREHETDLVVLAVPYPAGRDLAAEHADALAGTVVVDISNPVDFAGFDALVTPPGTSAAEIIAEQVPSAPVVKAFNTTFAATLIAGRVAGRPLDVFLASDDHGARDAVAELVRSGGLNPLDAGPLRRARELEAMGFLHMTLQDRIGFNWASTIAVLS